MPVEELIGVSAQAAVGVRRIVAFPDGFQLELVAWLRTAPKWRPFPGYPRRQIILSADRLGLRGEDGSVLKELVLFGVQFPDSAKVTNFDWARRRGSGVLDLAHTGNGRHPAGLRVARL